MLTLWIAPASFVLWQTSFQHIRKRRVSRISRRHYTWASCRDEKFKSDVLDVQLCWLYEFHQRSSIDTSFFLCQTSFQHIRKRRVSRIFWRHETWASCWDEKFTSDVLDVQLYWLYEIHQQSSIDTSFVLRQTSFQHLRKRRVSRILLETWNLSFLLGWKVHVSCFRCSIVLTLWIPPAVKSWCKFCFMSNTFSAQKGKDGFLGFLEDMELESLVGMKSSS